jgi:hypothetical protein
LGSWVKLIASALVVRHAAEAELRSGVQRVVVAAVFWHLFTREKEHREKKR